MGSERKPSKEERKLAAIMFTDIQGFTRLMAKDEPATIKMLEEQTRIMKQLISQYKGRLIKTIGDKVMADFKSAVNAVRCGIEIQREISKYNENRPDTEKLLVRIGIHIGDVVIRGKDIFGDGVNIASRIEPFAEAGEICISRAVYDQVRTKVSAQMKSIGLKRLKNVEEPVGVYALLSPERKPVPLLVKKFVKIRLQRIVIIVVSILAVVIGIFVLFTFTKQNPNKYFIEAKKNLRDYNFETAKFYLEMALDADSTFALAYAYLACIIPENEEIVKKALKYIDRASKKDSLYIEGCVAKAQGNYEQALKIYKKIVTLYPKDEEARCELAFFFRNQQMFSEAINQYKEAIRLNPNCANAYKGLGDIYRTTGKFPEAIDYYNRYRELSNPEDPKVYMTFAELYRYIGDYTKAIQEFNKAQEKQPNFEIFRLGRIYLEIGKYDKAINCYHRYVSIQDLPPLKAMGHKDLAFVYLAKRDYDRALKEAETALSFFSPYSSAVWIMGLAYVGKGVYAQARAEAENLKFLREDLYYHHLMGKMHLGQLYFDEAIDHLTKTVSVCDANERPFFIDALAEAYFKKGDLNRAIKQYKEVFTYNPNYAHSHFMLAQVYEKKDSTDAAVEEYEKFLEIWQDADYDLHDFMDAKENLESLKAKQRL